MNGRRGCSTVWPFDTVVGGCVLTPPLCPGGPVFCLVFSLVLVFGFVFRWVLGVVWYCSATGLLLFCLNDSCGGLDGCFRMQFESCTHMLSLLRALRVYACSL